MEQVEGTYARDIQQGIVATKSCMQKIHRNGKIGSRIIDGVFAGQVYQRRHIPAHITIAKFISIEDSLKIRAQLQEILPSGSFLCDKLSFIVPDEDFKFQRKGVFPLGNT